MILLRFCKHEKYEQRIDIYIYIFFFFEGQAENIVYVTIIKGKLMDDENEVYYY